MNFYHYYENRNIIWLNLDEFKKTSTKYNNCYITIALNSPAVTISNVVR